MREFFAATLMAAIIGLPVVTAAIGHEGWFVPPVWRLDYPAHRVRAQTGSRQRGPPRTRRERVRFADFLLCSIGRSNNMKIYLAGPLFNIAERHLNKELARLLRDKGHEVWLPQEFEQRTMTAKEIFVKDVEGLAGKSS
jgi:hypothetical protein